MRTKVNGGEGGFTGWRDLRPVLVAASLGTFLVWGCAATKLEHGAPAPVDAQRADSAVPLGIDGDGTSGPSADGHSDAKNDVSVSDAAPPQDAAVEASVNTGPAFRHIFVIAMENADAAAVYNASSSWPYLNALLSRAARALAFVDELPTMPSEPHYVWMEAGTNVFADHTFTNDDSPSAWNSTGTSDHLVAQLARAANGLDWMSYQEGLDARTGACPVTGAGFYCPRHNPFIFFRDVVGMPPSSNASTCVAHHRGLSSLPDDLGVGSVKPYNFITPNLCHDAHGQPGCPSGDPARAADQWLSTFLPALIAFVNDHQGVIFIVWDEGTRTNLLPFIALGPHVKPNYASSVPYTHGSLLKSVEELLGLPILPTVASANDFADLFEAGSFP